MNKVKNLIRIYEILRVLLKYDFDDIVFSIPMLKPFRFLLLLFPWNWFRKHDDNRGYRLKCVLQDLGPIFVKFGQILATRRDFLPDDVALELTKLLDKVQPFSPNVARNIIEVAFQKDLEKVFNKFSSEPLACASIAQVHSAELLDGTEVVVKIVRPTIKETIHHDIAILYFLSGIIEKYWSPAIRLRPSVIVAEIEKTILGELDMYREGANATQIGRNFKESEDLYIPKIYWDYTHENILVMERIFGFNILEKEALINAGVDIRQIAKKGVSILFTQIFRDNFFHADMHPGNIFVMVNSQTKDVKFGLVDFGIMGSLSKFDQNYLAENCSAFFAKDYRRVAELHVESGWVPAETRVDEFEFAIRSVCEPVFDRPLEDISVGQLLLRLFQTARKFEMEILPQLLLLQKSLVTIEGIGRQLDPKLDLWEATKPSVESFVKNRYSLKNLFSELSGDFPDVIKKISDLPQLANDILSKIQAEKLELRTRDAALSTIRSEVRSLGKRLVFSLLGFGFMAMTPIMFFIPTWVSDASHFVPFGVIFLITSSFICFTCAIFGFSSKS